MKSNEVLVDVKGGVVEIPGFRGTGICPFCKSGLSPTSVACSKCRTRTCEDCWESGGEVCATFACADGKKTPTPAILRSGFDIRCVTIPMLAACALFYHLGFHTGSIERSYPVATKLETAAPQPGRVYHVTVDQSRSLAEMVADGHYGDVNNKRITTDDFPVTSYGKYEVDLELISPPSGATSSLGEFIEWVGRSHLRPANIQELLAFGAKYPEEQRFKNIVATDGYGMWWPCLDSVCSASTRRLVVSPWSGWSPHQYILLAHELSRRVCCDEGWRDQVIGRSGIHPLRRGKF